MMKLKDFIACISLDLQEIEENYQEFEEMVNAMDDYLNNSTALTDLLTEKEA